MAALWLARATAPAACSTLFSGNAPATVPGRSLAQGLKFPQQPIDARPYSGQQRRSVANGRGVLARTPATPHSRERSPRDRVQPKSARRHRIRANRAKGDFDAASGGSGCRHDGPPRPPWRGADATPGRGPLVSVRRARRTHPHVRVLARGRMGAPRPSGSRVRSTLEGRSAVAAAADAPRTTSGPTAEPSAPADLDPGGIRAGLRRVRGCRRARGCGPRGGGTRGRTSPPVPARTSLGSHRIPGGVVHAADCGERRGGLRRRRGGRVPALRRARGSPAPGTARASVRAL